jgi:hypothetical protein
VPPLSVTFIVYVSVHWSMGFLLWNYPCTSLCLSQSNPSTALPHLFPPLLHCLTIFSVFHFSYSYTDMMYFIITH